MRRDILDINTWAAETLAMIDEEVNNARADALNLIAANNEKWAARRAMRENLTARYGDVVGLIMYRAALEKAS